MERIKDKILEIEEFLNELVEILPSDFNSYDNDFKGKAACERYFEKIVEAATDLAYLMAKEKKLGKTETDTDVFDLLSKHKIITLILAEKLKDAKGMRNILAHEYGKVDDHLVFAAVTQEIQKDIEEYINQIEKYLLLK
ncbi:MAG TPA: DUF86 domain-containing protein [Candidatus Nanoarchaeia archaeon]|nr:DUF86 domain-containing protein [Candidatus Nanoarchaeia archaeon]